MTSQTYLAFIEEINKNKKIDDPKKYLFGIAKIIFFKYLKSKYSKEEISFDEFSITDFEQYTQESQDEFLKNDRKKIAKKYIDQLPEKQKEILTLRLLDDLSLTLISELLHKDMNYVKTTQKRGIANLKKLLACTPART